MSNPERKEAKRGISFPSANLNNSLASINKINSVSTRIRKIGNSKGIILNNRIISALDVEDGEEVIVTAEKGRIIITAANNKRKINTDLSTWEAQFKAAIKGGETPETDIFEGMENEFDKEEW